ncbi:MAG: hypothetical protein GY862_13930 [Gammaproteobacteria bacterium]|nr:hypothetical protein [Gammaproteobacteria bacterium]
MIDPFAILAVDRAASKLEIMKQVTMAMREGKHNAKQIAEAQKTLFDPLARAVAEFACFIDPRALSEGSENIQNEAAEPAEPQKSLELEILTCFDE